MSSSCFPLPTSDDPAEPSPPPSPTTTTTITQTIGRQLHSVASFLAPPPPHPYSPPSSNPPPPPPPLSGDVPQSSYQGLKNDLAEIGDSLKTGLSFISPKKAVTGISKFASNFLQFDQEHDDCQLGITDDVLDFVRQISTRPEIWVDFPLSLHNKDFNMSPFQNEHSLAIQELVPNFTALKNKLQNVMSEEHFWLIYFILLVPRLHDDDDRRLLLTAEILQTHQLLLQKLRNKNNAPVPTRSSDVTLSEKGSTVNRVETGSSGETDGSKNMTRTKTREDEVCFSELEDEELRQAQSSSRVSSASENSDWVRIGAGSKANRLVYRERRSESEESSSDWHAVEDVDL